MNELVRDIDMWEAEEKWQEAEIAKAFEEAKKKANPKRGWKRAKEFWCLE